MNHHLMTVAGETVEVSGEEITRAFREMRHHAASRPHESNSHYTARAMEHLSELAGMPVTDEASAKKAICHAIPEFTHRDADALGEFIEVLIGLHAHKVGE